MILVETISISEFRGIHDLTLDLRGKNFAICGPNGTGKSGVVDALEFVLTGNVSRLSGEGRGEISLKQHGPHVDKRNDPDRARVKVRVRIPELGKSATIERSLKSPATALVTPNEPEVINVLRQVQAHPEVVLSRRELIKYVLATPGKRAEEVQALLHLDQVDQVRGVLLKIANACERQLAPLGTVATQARENLLRAMGLSELSKEKVLAVANVHRTTLGLPALADLAESTSLKDGLAVPGKVQQQRIPKVQAKADLHACRDALAEISSDALTRGVAELMGELHALAADPALLSSVKRETFYSVGLEIAETDACPFCDTAWDLGTLKKRVQAKVDHLKDISRRRKAVEAKLVPLLAALRKVQSSVRTVSGYGGLATPPVDTNAATDYLITSAAAAERLVALLPLSDAITALSGILIVPQTAIDTIAEVEKVINALPDPSRQDAARDCLTIDQERLEAWREAMRKQKAAKEQAQKTRRVSDIYTSTSDAVLGGIYAAVEKDFASIYQFINRNDEGKFSAKLIPSMGKLGFDVDFYGRGFFPPGAYHSEGHQDGMGLCLYLALMRHLQGAGFTFAVLDDVLMSIDAGHRREVCALLKAHFPNTQFVMTTHDPIWLRHMRTESLIEGRAGIHFRAWSVEHGPTRWDDRDVWAEIADDLKDNNVGAAAALLRHYLEYTSAELCHRLRAPVEFRGDAQYQLGELLPAAMAHMRKLLRRAKDAANSWKQIDLVKQLGRIEATFAGLVTKSNVEQWQVNAAVHFNSWDTLGKGDFEPVVAAYQAMLEGFSCPACKEYLRVSPDRESPEALRCDCGETNINLRKKGE